MKYSIIFIFFFLVLNSCTTIKEGITGKSSLIPEKRAFPINTSINPCENFYEYACSKVIDSFQLREDRSRHAFSFSDASERILKLKKNYFSKLKDQKPGSPMEKELKTYYVACMNKDARIVEEKDLVRENLRTINNIKTRKEFQKFIASNVLKPDVGFLAFQANIPNQDKPAYNDLLLWTSLMYLPDRSYYKNKELVQELEALYVSLFKTIGAKDVEKKAHWVINFEKGLIQVYPTHPEIRKLVASRTQISRSALINDYSALRLKDFLHEIPGHVHIRNIIGTKTMEYLNTKLSKAPLEELKSVFLVHQLSSKMKDAYPELYNKFFAFKNKYLGGPKKRPDRHEMCTKDVMKRFTKELDYTLLPKLFPNFPKKKFVRSIEKIRAALLDSLKENTWLSRGAKKEAIRKIAKAKLELVSPNTLEEWDFNPRATYSLDKPIKNFNLLISLWQKRHLNRLKGPVSKDRWSIGPLTINALYHPAYNKITFPIGILQYPFYDPTGREEINLGAIGAVIGHELGHSIDDNGNKYNADGLLKSWLTKQDKKIFEKKSSYLVTQYDKIGHNGKFTLGENIGDLVGLSTGYRAAFPKGIKKSKESKQRFFLQYARLWCEVELPKITQLRLKIDPHSLGFARVNEQMKHHREFKQAYDCKDTDPLVIPSKDIVKIW